jgi:transmembrane sensor
VNNICDSESQLPLPESVRGEAAVWLARLHSDTRSEQTEVGFRHWLAASPLHRAAFERMTTIWESTANVHRGPPPRVQESREFRRALRRTSILTAAVLCLCALITVTALYLMRLAADSRSESFATVHGERRSVRLADGSHLELNTDSRVRVTFGSRARRIILEKGQAEFEVVPDRARPFVVRAGGRQVVVLGTQFDVRWTDEQLSIVLIQGQVAILPGEAPLSSAASASVVTLKAGERLEFQGPTFAVKSTARLDREEAWMTGRVVFEATRLGTAIAEMNRYAPRRLELANPALADLLISGTFSVDDPGAFARAVAQIFSLEVSDAPDALLISAPAE